ncbi:MAG TPA: hypothetical protein PLD25_30400 [Chloroflexota bacterium]|nr:hypothetical protein [Chloroflexota bacterium]
MTPQELNETVQRYRDIVRDPATSQEAFLAALAAVQAARVLYESTPTAVYPLGSFAVLSGQMIAVDAFGSAEHAVSIPSVLNGAWHAWVGVAAGVHVALFACHDTAVPAPFPTLPELMQAAWVEVGSVPIDTATCALADREAYLPLAVEEVEYQIAGLRTHLCFSNTANADGGYPVFVRAENGQVVAVYVEFMPLAEVEQ